MSDGDRHTQGNHNFSDSKTKRPSQGIEESNQNLSMNVNCPSSDSKNRLSDGQLDLVANRPVTEFRSSEPYIQVVHHETQIVAIA